MSGHTEGILHGGAEIAAVSIDRVTAIQDITAIFTRILHPLLAGVKWFTLARTILMAELAWNLVAESSRVGFCAGETGRLAESELLLR